MHDVMFAVAVFVILILPALVYWLDHAGHNSFIGEVVSALKASGLRLYYNIEGDVMAVCTKNSFDEGLARHEERLVRGVAKSWDKVISQAKPTFTFAGSEETLRPIHTGKRKDLEPILNDVIANAMGRYQGEYQSPAQWRSFVDNVLLHDLSREEYEKAIGTILIRDSRLFVPYCGSVPKAIEQFAFYGQTTLEQARQHIRV